MIDKELFEPGELLCMRTDRRHWTVTLYRSMGPLSESMAFLTGTELSVVVCLAVNFDMAQVIVPEVGVGWIMSYHLTRVR